MKTLIATLILCACCMAQNITVSGGTTAGNIYPAATGQDLGNSSQRWDAFLQSLDLSSGYTLSATGTFATGAMNLYNQTNLGSVNFLTEFQYDQGGAAHYQTNDLTLGVATPNTSTVTNINGLAVFATTSADSSTRSVNNTVAAYLHCRVISTNGACWGENPIVSDTAGITGGNLVGSEIDVNVTGATTSNFVRGLDIIGCGNCISGAAGTAPTDSIGVEVRGIGGFTWPTGIQVDRGSSGQNAIVVDGLNSTNNTTSASIAFWGYDSGGTVHKASINADATGNLQLNPATGSAYFILNSGGGIWLPGSSSGNTIIKPAAVASGTLKLPAATGAIPYLSSCGTTTTCANTDLGNTGHIVAGSCAFSSATTCTVTAITGFTSSSSYFCTVTEASNTGVTFKVANVSASSFTVTASGSSSDTVNYMCAGN